MGLLNFPLLVPQPKSTVPANTCIGQDAFNSTSSDNGSVEKNLTATRSKTQDMTDLLKLAREKRHYIKIDWTGVEGLRALLNGFCTFDCFAGAQTNDLPITGRETGWANHRSCSRERGCFFTWNSQFSFSLPDTHTDLRLTYLIWLVKECTNQTKYVILRPDDLYYAPTPKSLEFFTTVHQNNKKRSDK